MIFSTLVIVYNLLFETTFRQRRRISYKNYTFFRKMYLVSLNAINISMLSVALLMSVVVFGLFVASNVVRYYLIALIPIDFSLGAFIYLEVTRPQYNNTSILNFDNYYKKVRKIELSKTRLFEKIDEIQTQYDLETSALLKNLQKYNAIFQNNKKYQELSELIEKNRLEFLQNKNDLINYNNSIISQFDESISEYLIQGLNPSFEISEFHQIDLPQMKQFIIDINFEFETYVKQTTMFNIINKTPNQSKQIITALEASEFFNFTLSIEDIVKILKVVDQKVLDKAIIAEYLINKNYANKENLFAIIIENDWQWCFTTQTVEVLTKKQIIQLYSDIIEKNATKICNVVLKCNTIDQTDVLEKVLATTTVNNNCVQIIKFHRIIINNVQEFDDEINKYENMAYAILVNAKTPSNPNYNFITNIIKKEEFYENKSSISDKYYQIFDQMHEKYFLLTDVLMCFYDGVLAKFEQIDMKNVMSFYMENMKTLNEDGIRYLNLILSSIVLCLDFNLDNIKTAINSIKLDKFVETLDINNVQKAKINGKSLLKFLSNKKLEKIVPVVNRIEKTRLSLDNILSL